jgi:RNA-directed DNA polymerase
MGDWAIAQSPILGTTVTIDRLVKRVYDALTSWYIKVAPKYKSSPLFPIV